MIIKQKHYPTIEIDNKEKDIVQIWMDSKYDSNVIQIERDKIAKLIKLLEQLSK